MTGCLALRKDVYYVRLTYYDKDRKRKDKWISTGLSGRGAKQKATAMISTLIEKYSYLEKSEHLSKMADYLAMWKQLQINEVAETTYDGYHTYVDRHLIPYFRDLNLDIQDITAGHIMDYVNYLSNDGGRKDNKIGGQSIASIRKIISILRKVFDYAVVYGDIKINPALQVPLPKREKNSNNLNKNKRQVFLTAEDAQKMLNAFQGEEIGPIIFITLFYGLRKSEALGLRWKAVNFENDTISINHTVVGGNHIVAKDSTKTYCSERTYQLLPDIKDLLLKLKAQQEDYRRRLGSDYHNNDYIFKNPNGVPTVQIALRGVLNALWLVMGSRTHHFFNTILHLDILFLQIVLALFSQISIKVPYCIGKSAIFLGKSERFRSPFVTIRDEPQQT